MGSKTPDGHGQGPNGSSSKTPISCANPPKPDAATGLLQGTLEGQDEDGDDDNDSNGNGADLNNAHDQPTNGTKKKRKRTKKKSKKAVPAVQTSPPRLPLIDLFPTEIYPEGDIVEYTNKEWTAKDENLKRTTAEEVRHLAAIANMDETFLRDYRKAAEIHRQVRQHAQSIAKPGMTMTELAHEIDEGVRALTGHAGLEKGDALKAGLAFPTGLCLNNIGAHWTPNAGGKEVVLGYDDVLKIDFGVHVNGRIVDSAFTVAANPMYDPLLDAARSATNTGLREAGPDARISHISRTIQEVMESYEVEIKGKPIPVKAVRNITGHNILHYRIHGDKQVPFIASNTSQRMEEGDIFAIETFGTTGRGVLRDGDGVYGYGLNSNSRGGMANVHHKAAKSLLKVIEQNFGTLVFAKRYLERVDDLKNERNWHLGMRSLVQAGVVERYAPLVDVERSYIAQFEHTVLLRPNCKEVVSRGEDY